MGDAGGTRDGGGITERAGGIGVGAGVRVVAMAGLLAVDGTTMYHVFMNSYSRNYHPTSASGAAGWDFLTNHVHVLICARPMIRASDCGTSPPRSGSPNAPAHRTLSELVEEGYVLRERHGRRNRYQVKPDLPLRHPLVNGREVGDLLKVLLARRESPASRHEPREEARRERPAPSRTGANTSLHQRTDRYLRTRSASLMKSLTSPSTPLSAPRWSPGVQPPEGSLLCRESS